MSRGLSRKWDPQGYLSAWGRRVAPLIRYYPGWRGRCAAGRPWRAVGDAGAWRMVSEEPGRHASGRGPECGSGCADLSDPGTRAVVLAALRDAAGDPALFPACVVDGDGSRLWAVWLPERVYALIREQDQANLKPWASEGAALAAALVAVVRAARAAAAVSTATEEAS